MSHLHAIQDDDHADLDKAFAKIQVIKENDNQFNAFMRSLSEEEYATVNGYFERKEVSYIIQFFVDRDYYPVLNPRGVIEIFKDENTDKVTKSFFSKQEAKQYITRYKIPVTRIAMDGYMLRSYRQLE